MSTQETLGIAITASDVTGQKMVRVRALPADANIGEMVKDLLPQMSLPENDVEGRPLAYHALHEREGRHLHDSELVSEVLREGDRVVLQPNIDAGLSSTGTPACARL